MIWRRPLPTRAEILSVVFVIVVVMVVIVAAVEFPYPYSASSNYGFGPGWRCQDPGRGEPVCIKQR